MLEIWKYVLGYECNSFSKYFHYILTISYNKYVQHELSTAAEWVEDSSEITEYFQVFFLVLKKEKE